MSEEVDIEISEFLDGEIEENRLTPFINRCSASDSMKQKLARYAVARDSLRRARAGAARPGFAESVMEALAEEPVVLAPKGRNLLGGERARRVLRPAAGLAVAATVATMAILGLRGDNAPGPEQAVPVPSQGEQVAAGNIQDGPNLPQVQYADTQMRRPVAQPATAGDRAWLNDYLLRHNEATGFVGRSGFMPYVHIVTTEPEEGERPMRDLSERRMPVNAQPE